LPITLEQSLFEQSWKVILPVSPASGSLNVAVSVGVCVVTVAPFEGLTRTGALGLEVSMMKDLVPVKAEGLAEESVFLARQ